MIIPAVKVGRYSENMTADLSDFLTSKIISANNRGIPACVGTRTTTYSNELISRLRNPGSVSIST